MARTKQQLINYHTSSKTSMPSASDVQFGEIVVRHNSESPELLIKVESANTETFVNFIDKTAVETLVAAAETGLAGEVEALKESASLLSGAVDTLSETLVSDYATKTYAEGEADAAEAAAKIASSAYTDSKIAELSGNVVTEIESELTDVTADIEALQSRATLVSGAVDTLSGSIVSDYATKAYAEEKAGDAEAAAKIASSAYTDSKITELSGNVVTAIEAQSTDVTSKIEAVSGNVIAVSGAVKTLSGNVVSYVDTKLSAVYKYKGTVATCADLPANPENGDVYNVIAASGSTPAGSNYAWSESESKWDALGGSIDTSVFATQSDMEQAQADIEALQARATAVSGAVDSFSAAVESNYATKTYAESEADDAESAAKIASSAYTDSKINELSGNVVTAIASQGTDVTSKIEALSGNVINLNAFSATVATDYATKTYAESEADAAEAAAKIASSAYTDSKINELSGITSAYVETKLTSITSDIENLQTSAATWNAKTGTAIQGGALGTVSTASSTQSGAKMAFEEGGNITLDLSELIIDCGSF